MTALCQFEEGMSSRLSASFSSINPRPVTACVFTTGMPSSFGQSGGVDAPLPLLGHIDHVQHQNRRQAEFEHLGDHVEIALDIGGIDHADDTVRTRRIGPAAQQHIPQNGLIGRAGIQAVSARQVDQPQFFAMLAVALADLLFDGHAGVVGHLLLQAREQVEERGLPRVRVAHDGDERCLGSGVLMQRRNGWR
jgi:hypothetical protein